MGIFRLFKEAYLGLNRPKKKKFSGNMLSEQKAFENQFSFDKELDLSEEEQIRLLEDSKDLLEQFGFNVEEEVTKLKEDFKEPSGK